MSGRISAATERALALVTAGMIPYRAARQAGISLSTMYRVLKAKRERAKQPTSSPAP